MNTSTKYPTTTLTLTLAMILLAACDNEVIAPYTVLSPTPATDAAAEASRPASAQSFGPEALAGASGRFSIGVLPIVPEARPFQSAIWNAARRWTEILRETELPDFILHGPKPDWHGINLATSPGWWTPGDHRHGHAHRRRWRDSQGGTVLSSREGSLSRDHGRG